MQQELLKPGKNLILKSGQRISLLNDTTNIRNLLLEFRWDLGRPRADYKIQFQVYKLDRRGKCDRADPVISALGSAHSTGGVQTKYLELGDIQDMMLSNRDEPYKKLVIAGVINGGYTFQDMISLRISLADAINHKTDAVFKVEYTGPIRAIVFGDISMKSSGDIIFRTIGAGYNAGEQALINEYIRR